MDRTTDDDALRPATEQEQTQALAQLARLGITIPTPDPVED